MVLWHDNLEQRIKDTGMSLMSFSAKAGVEYSSLRKALRGNRDVQVSTLTAICKTLGVTIDEVINSTVIKAKTSKIAFIVGQVAAGMWFEGKSVEQEPIGQVMCVNGRWSDYTQIAYEVVGDSMDQIGISDGSIIITVEYWKARDKIQDNDIVVVERRNGDLTERTVKVVSIHAEEYWLEPRSSNQRWKNTHIVVPREYNDTTDAHFSKQNIEITGLVIACTRLFS